jgi:hypothetical protein
MIHKFININEYQVEIDYSVEKNLKSFKEEMLDYLSEKCKTYKKIYLLLSGGMDSQMLAHCLRELNVDFEAVTYCFNPNFTDYDSVLSSKVAKQLDIKHNKIYLNKEQLFEHIEKLAKKEIVYPVLNNYYLDYAMNKNGEGIYISGACSEFKIQDNQISIHFNILSVHQNNKNIFNFTTERIFLSYINDEIFINEYQKHSDPFAVREKIYAKYFPNIKIEKKTWPEDEYIREDFYDIIKPNLFLINPLPFITKGFMFDIEEYFKGKKLRSNNEHS